MRLVKEVRHLRIVDIMDKYDNLGIIGEGSYGVVIKCKHKQSGQVSKHDNLTMVINSIWMQDIFGVVLK